MNLSISIFSLFLKNIFENTSTNIFWRKYLTNIFRWKYFDKIFLVNKNYSTTIFWRKYFDKIFQTKIVRRNISDENISTILFRWKYFDEIFLTKKIVDEQILAKIFRRDIYCDNVSTKYFRRKYSTKNVYGEDVADEIFLTKILLINSAPPPRFNPRAARSSQNPPFGRILLLARFIKYLWRIYGWPNICDENIVDQICTTKIFVD